MIITSAVVVIKSLQCSSFSWQLWFINANFIGFFLNLLPPLLNSSSDLLDYKKTESKIKMLIYFTFELCMINYIILYVYLHSGNSHLGNDLSFGCTHLGVLQCFA